MAEESTTAATDTAQEPLAGAGETTRAGSGETASGSTIPQNAGDDQQQAETRANELEALQPWAAAVAQLAAMGYSPEQVQQALQSQTQTQAQAPATDPQQQLHQWIEAQTGVTVDQLTAAEYVALQSAYRTEQWISQQQQQQQAAAEAQQRAAVESELAAAMAAAPPALRGDSVFLDAVRGLWVHSGRPFAEIVKTLAMRFETAGRNELAQSAIRQQQEQQRPVTAGGGVPPGLDEPDVTKMSQQQFQQHVRDTIRAKQAASAQ